MPALRTILVLANRLASLFSSGEELSVVGSVAYYNPTLGGGSMLNNAEDGYGEPLNVRPFHRLYGAPHCVLTSRL